MQTFKKIIASTLSVLLIWCIVSIIVITPYYTYEAQFYEDKNVRAELAGTIDYVFIGASYCLAAFNPQVIDSELGCNSYNLSNSAMTMYGKYELLKKELSRNPINTVVLEISCEHMQSEGGSINAIGDEPTIARLDNGKERLEYILKYVDINTLADVFARAFTEGLKAWVNNIILSKGSAVDYSLKNYHPLETVSVKLTEDEAISVHNTEKYTGDFCPDNLKYLEKIIDMCHENNVRVIIAVTPLSDAAIWKYENLDDFVSWGNEFCDQHNCEFVDLNLVKNRYEVFSDDASFYNETHLSSIGADCLSRIFSDVMKRKTEGGDSLSEYFYNSYEELKNDSPYMKYIK